MRIFQKLWSQIVILCTRNGLTFLGFSSRPDLFTFELFFYFNIFLKPILNKIKCRELKKTSGKMVIKRKRQGKYDEFCLDVIERLEYFFNEVPYHLNTFDEYQISLYNAIYHCVTASLV